MTTPAVARQVIVGVDTHKHTHHAAVLDAGTGKLLADREFAANRAGYRSLLDWVRSLGEPVTVGIEGTGSFGAGLFRHLDAAGVRVIEVLRPNRQARRLAGKSDPIDAIAAARAVLSGLAEAVPKSRTGPVEAIRVLRTARSSAVKARRAAINQIHAALWGGPEPLRDALGKYSRAALVSRCARLRPTGAISDPATATKTALRILARRVQSLDSEIAELDEQLDVLILRAAPRMTEIFGAGTETVGQILTTAGDNPHRIGSEAALARLCGTAPIPASSGNTTRHRLHRGGDRQANRALHMIVVVRLRWHAPTRAYVQRRTAEGKTKKEIIRCLKRALVREIYTALRADFAALQPTT
jgi:transposase